MTDPIYLLVGGVGLGVLIMLIGVYAGIRQVAV